MPSCLLENGLDLLPCFYSKFENWTEVIGCHFGDKNHKKRLWLPFWVLSLLNRLLLWKWWTSAAVSRAAMWWGPHGWAWKISQATTTALTNTSVRQPEPPSSSQILHPRIHCFQPLEAVGCATKENKCNSCLLSPYYATGTVPCTSHYESWQRLWVSAIIIPIFSRRTWSPRKG